MIIIAFVRIRSELVGKYGAGVELFEQCQVKPFKIYTHRYNLYVIIIPNFETN